MPNDLPPATSIAELADTYEGFLLDAYGVLVHSGGAFEGAVELVDHLQTNDIPFAVVTNDASRLPATNAERYTRFGFELDPSRIVTAGGLLEPFFADHDLEGASTAVLGTEDSETYVRRAGGEVVDPTTAPFDVLALCDDAGFDFRPTVNATLTRLIRRIREGDAPRLVVPNPDMTFQRGPDAYGVAAGSLAALFEAMLADRFPGRDLTFDRLGKPYAPIYDEALRRIGTEDVVMIGDQLKTDIAGAVDRGLATALVDWGLDDPAERLADADLEPDYLLESLEPPS